MSRWTTFKVGGPADLLLSPRSNEQLAYALSLAADLEIPVEVIGGGSNLIVRDGGIRGLVVAIRENLGGITKTSPHRLLCAAGTRMTELSQFAQELGLSGLEFAIGIPGTLGGAIFMNAGAYGAQIADTVQTVDILDETLLLRRIEKEALAFSYRDSLFMQRPAGSPWRILSAELELIPDDPAQIRERMDTYTRERLSKQPVQFASAGSVFKRPQGYYTGKLIEECGLKGYSLGGAQVSQLHAGFIINTGGATASDVLSLIELIKMKVFEHSGVLLQTEVRIVGVD